MWNYNFSDIEKRKKIYNTLIKTLYRLDNVEAKKDTYKVDSNQETIEDYIKELDNKITLVGNAIERLSEVKDNKIAKRIRKAKERNTIPSKISWGTSRHINSTTINNYETNTGMWFLGTLFAAGLGYLIADALFWDEDNNYEEELIEPSELNDSNTEDVAELEDEDNENIDSEDEFNEDVDEEYDNSEYEENDYNSDSNDEWDWDVDSSDYNDDYNRYDDSYSDDSSWSSDSSSDW